MHGRVLYIDDVSSHLPIIEGVITAFSDFTCSTGENGKDLARLLEAHDDVVAILCDQNLRGEYGLGLQSRHAATLAERRIAFVLFHGEGKDFQKSLPPGYFASHNIVEILKPPRRMEDLIATITSEVLRLRS